MNAALLHRPLKRCYGTLARRASQPFSHLKQLPTRTPIRMVEGPQCHRVAHAHRKLLKGHAYRAMSPNNRFTEGAKAMHGKVLNRIEVHGKNLFYFFGDGTETVVMHIHFGMSGHFRTSPAPGPETTPTTRLRLENDKLGIVAHLSAMTVQHGNLEFYEKQSAKIGPDPLREDADVEVLWQTMQKSKKPVGLILMDQSMVGGIGNIYRAEILFKAKVHPEQPGNTVDRAAFDRIWEHSVLLLQRGFTAGSILTVDPAEAKILGPPWTRRYIYNHPTCGRCKGTVQVWDMAARTVYACPQCQPLVEGTQLASNRNTALGKATPHKKFKSSCAPEPAPPTPRQLTVAELRAKLESLGRSTAGRKADLAARLAEAAAAQTTDQEAIVKVPPEEAAAAVAEGAPADPVEETAPSLPAAASKRRKTKASGTGKTFTAVLATEDKFGEKVSVGLPEKDHWDILSVPMLKMELEKLGLPTRGKKPDLVSRLRSSTAEGPVKAEPAVETRVKTEPTARVKPGLKGLGKMATAQEAEAEKKAAGEGRNVEHVALHVDEAVAAAEQTSKRPQRKRKAAAK